MRALRYCGEDGFDDVVPVEKHVEVVEPQHDVAPGDESSVGFEVAPAIRRAAVVIESVDLCHERGSDEPVDGSSVDPDLLTHGDACSAHPVHESGLESRVGQR